MLLWLCLLRFLLLFVGTNCEAGDNNTVIVSLTELFDSKTIHAYILYGGKEDRRANCIKLMKNFGLEERHYDFIPGPRHISDEEILEHKKNGSLGLQFNETGYHMSIERYLCQLGKLRAMSAFLASNYSEMIFFEDDVTYQKKFTLVEAVEYMRLMLLIPSADYDIQYLGYCFECARRNVHNIKLKHTLGNTTNQSFHYRQVLMPLCNHAVLLNRRAVKAFMALSRPFNMPGDVYMALIICKTGIMAIRPGDSIFVQDRKKYGSYLGHKNEVKAFRQGNNSSYRDGGRCSSDDSQCRRQFNVKKAMKYGFSDRIRNETSLIHHASKHGNSSNLATAKIERNKSLSASITLPVPLVSMKIGDFR